LRLALKNYPNQCWWEICEGAATACSDFGTIYKGQTVKQWWQIFQEKDAFHHHRGQMATTSLYWLKLPAFFCEYPALHKKFVKYCTLNLQDLNVNLAWQYVSDKLIPAAIADLLKALYGIGENPGRTTIYEWLVKLGFKYAARRKWFHVDTHESASNCRYRKLQTQWYLQWEHQMYHWFQVPVTQAEIMEQNKQIMRGTAWILVCEWKWWQLHWVPCQWFVTRNDKQNCTKLTFWWEADCMKEAGRKPHHSVWSWWMYFLSVYFHLLLLVWTKRRNGNHPKRWWIWNNGFCIPKLGVWLWNAPVRRWT